MRAIARIKPAGYGLGYWSAILVLVLLFGCRNGPVTVGHDILERGNAVALQPPGPLYRIIESQSEFLSLYEQLHSGRIPAPESPEVDFSRSLVLLVAMEEQPTAGYSIEITGTRLNGETLVVPVLFSQPSMDKPRATVITRPYILVRIFRPPSLGGIEFRSGEGELLAEFSLE